MTWRRPETIEGLKAEITRLAKLEKGAGSYYSAERSNHRTKRQECEGVLKMMTSVGFGIKQGNSKNEPGQ